MTDLDRIALLGSQLASKGESARGALPGVAAALHTGRGPSLNPKLWPCEDSLVCARLPGGELLACVADAHWGGSSAEAFTGPLPAALSAVAGHPPTTRIYRALLALERDYQAGRPAEDRSETTVLAALVSAGLVSWLNVGDSLLLLLPGAGQLRPLNEPTRAFVGNVPLGDAPAGHAWTAGRQALAPGDLLLLASDGLEPEVSGLELPQVEELLRAEGPLAARLEGLLERASDPARGGGRDNLALIAVEAPR